MTGLLTLRNLLIFSLGLPFCSAEAAIPRLRPDVNTPGRPNSPGSPGTLPKVPEQGRWPPDSSPGRGGTPTNEQAQARIQYKMGNMENRLEVEKKYGVVREGPEVMKNVADLVSSVLDKEECQDSDVHNATNPCTSASFKPTTATVPPQSFAQCSSYAKIISSCASATSSFYSLNATAQASCACYATPVTIASTGPVCTGTKQAQVTGAPTLAIRNFDDKANACFSYFSAQGYNNLAAVLGGSSSQPTGSQGNQPALGSGFCSKIDADVKKGNGSSGLGPSLKSMVWTDCKGLVNPEAEGATKSMGVVLNSFDRIILLTSLPFVSVLSLFIFT
ncbi:hypothetical protein DM02DRAFT_658551 [Periconia macrospinosa]|uniref:Extracellular membrane protein CFEM domain-containing protein n=1 Tax=Periconia macrospinosa TaxID=97972 RepID=A0A2V1DGN6_9PLEO|nr:hypothetical protein DM02DRAFT_658551 [Periconia macrospinosa]